MRLLDTEEIKHLEFSLLLSFDRFCRENGLPYFLCGGTLLGAVRHKGFIPWDDDIDVIVPRPVFEKLLALEAEGKDRIGENAVLMSWRSGRIPEPFIKICDPRTLVKEQFLSSDHTVHVWIDVFVLDGLPDSETVFAARCRSLRVLRRLLLTAVSETGTGTTLFARLAKRILVPMLRGIDTKRICERMQAICARSPFGSSATVGGIIWGYGTCERMPRRFLDAVPVMFEGHIFPAPACFDQYLHQLYGDYMQLPPEEKRRGHGMLAYMEDGGKI